MNSTVSPGPFYTFFFSFAKLGAFLQNNTVLCLLSPFRNEKPLLKVASFVFSTLPMMSRNQRTLSVEEKSKANWFIELEEKAQTTLNQVSYSPGLLLHRSPEATHFHLMVFHLIGIIIIVGIYIPF